MNKENEYIKKNRQRVTFDIERFTGDKKGLRVGDDVVVNINGVLKTGKIERIFDYPAKNKQEAQIRCNDGKLNFKIEDDITKIAII